MNLIFVIFVYLFSLSLYLNFSVEYIFMCTIDVPSFKILLNNWNLIGFYVSIGCVFERPIHVFWIGFYILFLHSIQGFHRILSTEYFANRSRVHVQHSRLPSHIPFGTCWPTQVHNAHHASCTSRPCIMHACAQRKNLPYKHDACTPTFVRVRGRLAKYSMETEALQASEHSMVTQPPDQNAGSRNCWESAYHGLPYPSSRSRFQERDV
jgi:hypothetical protein